MRQLADAFRQKRHAFLTTYAAAHPLPPAFQQQAGLEIDLEWARHLLDFLGYHREATQQAAELPVGYYDFLQALPRRQLDEQVEWEPVLRLLAAYGGRLLPNGPLPADSAEVRRLYAQATTDFGPSRARDWAMYQDADFPAPAALLAAYPVFRTLNRDSTLGRNMRQLVQRELRMQPGQPRPLLRCSTKVVTPFPCMIFEAKSCTSISGEPGARPAGRNYPPAPTCCNNLRGARSSSYPLR